MGYPGSAFVTKVAAAGGALVYSTYLNAAINAGAVGAGIAVDGSGRAFVVGSAGAGFPLANASQGAFGGGVDDAFVTELDVAGSALVYSTYLGGSGVDGASGIAIDASGDAFVTGFTSSTDFPLLGAHQSANGGGDDAFVVEVGPGSTLVYSTYLGGLYNDYGVSIVIDASGNACVTGQTASPNFPLANPYQSSIVSAPAFISKFGPPLVLSPTSAHVPPRGSQAFATSGGTGGGYTYALQTNASGGSIGSTSGAFIAGPTGNVVDVVQVTDSAGNATAADVTVGPGVSISPSTPSAPPMGTVLFSASGGSGTSFSWSLPANQSGGNIDASTGAYAAGPTANTVDAVMVADSLGNTATVNVSVGGGLAVSPSTPTTPPKGAIAFSVRGGSGGGFAWALSTNASGSTIDPSSGAYVAGATGSVADQVKVVDSLGNEGWATVVVTAGVTVAPSTATVTVGGTLTFGVSGGSGTGYHWLLSPNASGGSIGASSGAYAAGSTGNVADVAQVVDSLGNSARATVNVALPASGDGGLIDAGDAGGEPIPEGGGLADAAGDAAGRAGVGDASPDAAVSSAGSSGGCGCVIARRSSGDAWGLGVVAVAPVISFARRRKRRESA